MLLLNLFWLLFDCFCYYNILCCGKSYFIGVVVLTVCWFNYCCYVVYVLHIVVVVILMLVGFVLIVSCGCNVFVSVFVFCCSCCYNCCFFVVVMIVVVLFFW